MKKLFLTLLICAPLLFACVVTIPRPDVIRGSGTIASEARPVSGFTSIELAGSADVEVQFGDQEAVIVEADDNILPLIETQVRNTVLVIETKANTSIQTTHGIHVTVTMLSLDAVSLPGSGNIRISGLQAERLKIDLPGSGNITVSGEVTELQATLGGSGGIYGQELKAKSANVQIPGSGNVEVYARDSLDATVSGSGSIAYFGDPAAVKSKVTGSGTIQER